MKNLGRMLTRMTVVSAAAVGVSAMAAQVAWANNASGVSPQSGDAATTNFQISLPSGAACSGDTATDGYRVDSYVVPSSVSPDSLNFSSGAANEGAALISAGGNPYELQATGVSSGVVLTPPEFSWSAYVGDFGTGPGQGFDLYTGSWNVGLICVTAAGVPDGNNYWNTVFTFAPSGSSGDFTWSTQQSIVPEVPWALILPLSGVAVVGGSLFLARRRRREVATIG